MGRDFSSREYSFSSSCTHYINCMDRRWINVHGRAQRHALRGTRRRNGKKETPLFACGNLSLCCLSERRQVFHAVPFFFYKYFFTMPLSVRVALCWVALR